jgi:hypothetical protein
MTLGSTRRAGAIAFLLAVASPPAFAGIELALFRESASLALVEIGMRDMPAGTFACVSVDDRVPTDDELDAFRDLHLHDVGGPGACVCVKGEPNGHCTRAENGQAACVVSVRAFELRDRTHASAELLVLCGWPRGSGQFADFEKRDGEWHYVGARTLIKL